MLQLPPEFQSTISKFSAVFTKPAWQKAQVLLLGAICCPGSRTVCNVLRTVGLSHDKRFDKYHRFLSRDKWSGLRLSIVLLEMLVNIFVPASQALVFGIDETVERRWGRRITKRGIYRDAVRSSASHFVKCSGLRWMCVMLLTPLPWLENRCWALPFLSVLCPSRRYWQKRSQPRTHKTLIDWAGQLIKWLSRYTAAWGRPVFVVGDGSYATYELMMLAAERNIGLISRLRMDARLFHLPPPPQKGKRGPKPKMGKRILSMKKRLSHTDTAWIEVTFAEWYGHANKTMLMTSGQAIWSRNKDQFVRLRWVLLKDPQGKLDPVLLGCSDLQASPEDIVRYFVRRWRVEVTFAEVRRHLGVETQRQWSDLAIERTTPLLMGTKSIICLLAATLFEHGQLALQHTAWYHKNGYTFSDIYAAVRQQILSNNKLFTSSKNSEVNNLKSKIRYLTDLLTLSTA